MPSLTLSSICLGATVLYNVCNVNMLKGPLRLTYILAYMKVINLKKQDSVLFLSVIALGAEILCIAISWPSSRLQPCFSTATSYN